MLVGANHSHSHAEHGSGRLGGRGTVVAADGHAHSHDEEATASGAGAPVAAAAPADWPRPFDPAQPVDLSGVDGVTPEQELRATALVRRTQEELPAFADVESLDELGYRSIGDSRTGYEHYINYSLINDDVILDPTQPESLVFRVDGDDRTLVSAMFIVGQRAIDDPELVDYGGRLMQWHVHENLCWRGGDERPAGRRGHRRRGQLPRRYGARRRRQPDGPRVDRRPRVRPVRRPRGSRRRAGRGGRRHPHRPVRPRRRPQPRHGDRSASSRGRRRPAAPPQRRRCPTIPSCPIDLSGTPGVTAEQQAFAENLVSSTLRDLPQWADTADAEAAGFHSIGDEATGYEHYIQWEWIDDDVLLDPDHPESLVYRVEPDGSRTLASAMYMLPNSMALDEAPDDGGALMQWHVHGDLCFDVSDPEAPRVAGLTDSAGGCTAPLVRLAESPMIHVWIVPHECGPFAALEGVAAGQVAAGEEHLCDHAHGSTTDEVRRLVGRFRPATSSQRPTEWRTRVRRRARSSQVRSVLRTSISLRDQTKRSTSSSTDSA